MNEKKTHTFVFFLSKTLSTHTDIIIIHYKSLAWAHAESPVTLQLNKYTVQTNEFIHQATCLQVMWCRTRFSPTGRGHGTVSTGRGRSAWGGDRGGGEHHSHCSSRASTKVPLSMWPPGQQHCVRPIQGSGRLTNNTKLIAFLPSALAEIAKYTQFMQQINWNKKHCEQFIYNNTNVLKETISLWFLNIHKQRRDLLCFIYTFISDHSYLPLLIHFTQ